MAIAARMAAMDEPATDPSAVSDDGHVNVVPILRVAQADRALRWWSRMGFVEEFRHQFGPGMPLFVGLVRDEARVYLLRAPGRCARSRTGLCLGPQRGRVGR